MRKITATLNLTTGAVTDGTSSTMGVGEAVAAAVSAPFKVFQKDATTLVAYDEAATGAIGLIHAGIGLAVGTRWGKDIPLVKAFAPDA